MNYNIFISYAAQDKDMAENFSEQIKHYSQNRLNVWVYSLNKSYGNDVWDDIKKRINKSNLVIFIISEGWYNAQGQHKELDIALQKINPPNSQRIMPLIIDNVNFNSLPEELKNKNGDWLNTANIKSISLKIIRDVFPSLTCNQQKTLWSYPIPGQWLEVSRLDGYIEPTGIDVGDKLYFRAISPMGLFECYSPDLEDLYWISHHNVIPYYDPEHEEKLERQMPGEFNVSSMINQRLQNK